MTNLSPVVRVVLMGSAWIIWLLALVVRRNRHHEKAVKKERSARWGVTLEMMAFVIVHTQSPETWNGELPMWRAIGGVICALLAIVAFWSAVSNLGRQFRVDAGLNQEHELVQTGAYRVVRHPIYASMLGMLLASIFWVGTLPGWPIAIVLYIVGTEIRVHIEDGLLQGRFGERFTKWQKSIPAYVPFVR